jgi:hypothetical protein
MGEGYSLSKLFSCLFLWHNINGEPVKNDLIFILLPITLLIGLPIVYNLYKKQKNILSARLLAATLIGLASWLQYYPVPGIGHVWWAAGGMAGVGILFFYEGVLWTGKKLKFSAEKSFYVFFILLACLTLPDLVRRALIFKSRTHSIREKVAGDNPLAGLYLEPGYIKNYVVFLEGIKKKFSQAELSKMVLYGYSEGLMLTFLEQHKPFHPLWASAYEWVYHSIYPDFQREYDQYILTQKPLVLSLKDKVPEFQLKYPGYVDRTRDESFMTVLEYHADKK